MKGVVKVATVWLFVVGVATYLFFVDPARGVGYPSCPFRILTGLQCPGCGSSRALHQLMHGHPVSAFELNPLLLLLLPLLALVLVSFSRRSLFDDNRKHAHIPPPIGWAVLGIVISFWIFRNTSLYPFVS